MRNETDRYNILGAASSISDNNGTHSETHNQVWRRAAITSVCEYFKCDVISSIISFISDESNEISWFCFH